jgi:hypothetical protein
MRPMERRRGTVHWHADELNPCNFFARTAAALSANLTGWVITPNPNLYSTVQALAAACSWTRSFGTRFPVERKVAVQHADNPQLSVATSGTHSSSSLGHTLIDEMSRRY